MKNMIKKYLRRVEGMLSRVVTKMAHRYIDYSEFDINYSDLSSHIDYSDLAENIDYSEIYIDYSDLAYHIDYSDLAYRIDHSELDINYSDLAYYIDYSELADHICTDRLAEHVTIDYEEFVSCIDYSELARATELDSDQMLEAISSIVECQLIAARI